MNLTNLIRDRHLLSNDDVAELMNFAQKGFDKYNQINDEFITKYYKYIDPNELVMHYKFNNLEVLGLVMSRFPDMRKVVRYQKLSLEFINSYVLNTYYYDSEEDVGIPEVIRYQTHLTEEEKSNLKWC